MTEGSGHSGTYFLRATRPLTPLPASLAGWLTSKVQYSVVNVRCGCVVANRPLTIGIQPLAELRGIVRNSFVFGIRNRRNYTRVRLGDFALLFDLYCRFRLCVCRFVSLRDQLDSYNSLFSRFRFGQFQGQIRLSQRLSISDRASHTIGFIAIYGL